METVSHLIAVSNATISAILCRHTAVAQLVEHQSDRLEVAEPGGGLTRSNHEVQGSSPARRI